MHMEHQGNFWLYPILRVNNSNCIHELLCRKPFVKFKYQTFCSRSTLVFHILASNYPIFLGDHGHNSNAFISFVQHVKFLFKRKGIIVYLCGGLNVPNYHIEVVKINLSQLHSCHKNTMKQFLF